MRRIVSNTTPILALLKINKLQVLKDLYGEIIISQAVFDEIEAGKSKEYYIDLSQTDWIKILNIKNEESLLYFLDLDRGEAETIILAKEINAELIILDETLGRFYAQHAQLKFTGTLGILLKAKMNGLIEEIKPLLHELTNKGIWLSSALIERTLKLANES